MLNDFNLDWGMILHPLELGRLSFWEREELKNER